MTLSSMMLNATCWTLSKSTESFKVSLGIATIQGRAKQSCITCSGITIRKYNHNLSLSILCYAIHIATIQGRAELSNLDRYYYWKNTMGIFTIFIMQFTTHNCRQGCPYLNYRNNQCKKLRDKAEF